MSRDQTGSSMEYRTIGYADNGYSISSALREVLTHPWISSPDGIGGGTLADVSPGPGLSALESNGTLLNHGRGSKVEDVNLRLSAGISPMISAVSLATGL